MPSVPEEPINLRRADWLLTFVKYTLSTEQPDQFSDMDAAIEGTDGATRWITNVNHIGVKHADSPAWLEGVRDENGELRIALFGLHLCASLAEARRALDGLQLVRAYTETGRRMSKPEFEDRVKSIIQKLRRKRWKITVKSVGWEMGLGRTQFYDHLHSFNLTWPPLKRKWDRCANPNKAEHRRAAR